jgi:Cytochrome bd terminal oxidase subunit I
VAGKNRPYSPLVFWSFRMMVGLGFAMLGIGLWSVYLRWRGRLFESRWLHRAALAMGPSGFVAVLAGWITTEAGRQPYTIYGLLRTVDSESPIAAPAVAASLVAFVVVYFVAFAAGLFFILRLMNRPPETGEPEISAKEPIRAAGITPGLAPLVVGARHDARPSLRLGGTDCFCGSRLCRSRRLRSPGLALPVRSRLRRDRDIVLSLHCPRIRHDLGSRVANSLAFLLVGASVLIPMILA